MEELLQQMWESNKDYLLRFLISLSKDIDLAEDLLQETYLRARAGISGYRDGNPRAWLAAIAKNVFYSQMRLRRVRMEVHSDVELPSCAPISNGSSDHLTAMQLRQAISDLSSTLRLPLLMKHYGGFTYEEIGARLGCPVGTAKRRVWDAMQKLRSGLVQAQAEALEMKCAQVRGNRLIEFLYGGLSDKDAEAVKAHLEHCDACKQEAGQLGEIITGLDMVEGDYRLTAIHDIDENGRATCYEWCTMSNSFGESMKSVWWGWSRNTRMEYLLAQGEEVEFSVSPLSARQILIEAELPTPVPPGEHTHTMHVARNLAGDSALQSIGKNRWSFTHQTTPNSGKEWVFVYAVRLPAGARLATATPEPSEVRTGERTTVVWRALLPRVEPREDGTRPWQFECHAEIEWETEAPLKAQPTPLPPLIPEELMEVSDTILELPYTDAKDRALQALAEAERVKLPYYNMWFTLGIRLYGSCCYEEALDAFVRSVTLPALPGFLHNNSVYLAHAWQGMILDLLGRRDEALEHYRQSLANPGRAVSNMTVFNLLVDKAFIEQRLKTPYERK